MGKLGVSPKESSNHINIKNRFPRFKSVHGITNFAGNQTDNHERQQYEKRNNSCESESFDPEKGSLTNEDSWIHIRTGQDNDVSSVTTSNAAGNEASEAVHSINKHNTKMQRIERGKNTLERIINIKKRFPRLRSPFKIRTDTCNIASYKGGCRNEKVTNIGDQKTTNSSTIDTKLQPVRVVKCSDFIPTSSLPNAFSNEGTLRKVVEAPTKELSIQNKKSALKCKIQNHGSVIACGDSKTEITCTNNQSKCTVYVISREEINTKQIGRQSTLDINDTQVTTPKSFPKLGFIERKSGGISYTSYVAMLNTERDTLADIRRITARRFWGLEQQFNCKIMLSNKPSKLRARTVYKLEIEGPTFREVAKCKNALPKCITEKLITEVETNREDMLLRNFRKV
nr:hypothetical transcript [Hymenolepis microstoma]